MPDSYIKTTGMRRSGHHGVMYWITANMDKNTILHEPPGVCVMEKKNYPGAAIKHGLKENLYIFNREEIHENNIKEYENAFKDKDALKVIVLRFAPNLFASRLKMADEKALFKKTFNSRAFKIYNWQAQLIDIGYFDVVIFYEDFITKEWYRKSIGVKLGLNKSCKNIFDITSIEGGGSSFDGLDKKPSQMNLTERYKALSEEHAIKLSKATFMMDYNRRWFPGLYKEFVEYFNL